MRQTKNFTKTSWWGRRRWMTRIDLVLQSNLTFLAESPEELQERIDTVREGNEEDTSDRPRGKWMSRKPVSSTSLFLFLSRFVYGIRVRTETRDPITNPSLFVLPVCIWPENPWKPKVSVTLFFSAVINSDVPSSLFSKIAGFSGNWSQDKWPAFSVTCPVSGLD